MEFARGAGSQAVTTVVAHRSAIGYRSVSFHLAGAVIDRPHKHTEFQHQFTSNDTFSPKEMRIPDIFLPGAQDERPYGVCRKAAWNSMEIPTPVCVLACNDRKFDKFQFVGQPRETDKHILYSASMVDTPRVISSSTSRSTLTVSREVNMVTLLSTAARRISEPSEWDAPGALTSMVLIT